MNGGFAGGNTRFFSPREWDETNNSWAPQPVQCEVVPAEGRCLIFRQPPGRKLLHDGQELESGVKYLFRSDVLYEKVVEEETKEQKQVVEPPTPRIPQNSGRGSILADQ